MIRPQPDKAAIACDQTTIPIPIVTFANIKHLETSCKWPYLCFMAEESIDKELINNNGQKYLYAFYLAYNNTVLTQYKLSLVLTTCLYCMRCFPVLFTGDKVNCFGQVQLNRPAEECQTQQTTLCHC